MTTEPKPLEIGDTVYADFGKYTRIDVRKGAVVKVTPTGQVSADFGRSWAGRGEKIIDRFTSAGWQVGGDGFLIDEEVYLRRSGKQKATEAKEAIYQEVRRFSFNTRAEAIERAQALLVLAEGLPE